MKKILVCFLVLCNMAIHMISAETIPLQFQREPNEPIDVYPDKLMASELDYTPELWNYAVACRERIKIFFNSLNCEYKPEFDTLYYGTWVLQDKEGKKKIKENKSEDQYEIHFFKANYNDNGNRLKYGELAPPTKNVYYTALDKLFFSQPWGYGIIKQVRIIDNKLYLYVLNGDYWKLDERHEDGTYFYVKHDLSLPFYP